MFFFFAKFIKKINYIDTSFFFKINYHVNCIRHFSFTVFGGGYNLLYYQYDITVFCIWYFCLQTAQKQQNYKKYQKCSIVHDNFFHSEWPKSSLPFTKKLKKYLLQTPWSSKMNFFLTLRFWYWGIFLRGLQRFPQFAMVSSIQIWLPTFYSLTL